MKNLNAQIKAVRLAERETSDGKHSEALRDASTTLCALGLIGMKRAENVTDLINVVREYLNISSGDTTQLRHEMRVVLRRMGEKI